MDNMALIVPLVQQMLWVGFVVFIRIGSMMFLVPVFGEQSVPMRVRLGATVAFTLIVAPGVAPEIEPFPALPSDAITLLGPEVLTGLFFGMMLRFFVFALQIAGSVAAQSTSLAQIFGGSAGVDAQPAIGHLLVAAGLALAAMMGLHVQIATYMLNTYQLVPLGTLMRPETLSELGVDEVSRAFALGFSLAAPFVIASLIYNVTLGVINRAMPQLMVSFVGAPAITAGGLLLLLVTAPVMLSLWVDSFGNFITAPFEGAR